MRSERNNDRPTCERSLRSPNCLGYDAVNNGVMLEIGVATDGFPGFCTAVEQAYVVFARGADSAVNLYGAFGDELEIFVDAGFQHGGLCREIVPAVDEGNDLK